MHSSGGMRFERTPSLTVGALIVVRALYAAARQEAIERIMSRLEQLQALLDKEPDDAFLNFGVAMELAKAERYDESLARFDDVIRNDPNYVAAHFHKAKTLLAMGETEAAKAQLEKGIAQAGACGESHAQGEMQELFASL